MRAAASGVLVEGSETCVHTRAQACTPTHTHWLPQHSFMHALLTHTHRACLHAWAGSHIQTRSHTLFSFPFATEKPQ